MKRIVIVGASCTGKSTLAKKLADKLNYKQIQLDEMYWLPNWVGRDKTEFRKMVSDKINDDTWVLDGDYGSVRSLIRTRSTTIIWLNYSFPLVFFRAIKRTFRRVITKEKVCGQNIETFKKVFFSKYSILFYVITSYASMRKRNRKALTSDEVSHAKIIELTTPKEAKAFLDSLKVQK